MEVVGRDLSVLAVVVVPLIALVVWVVRTLLGQVCDALRDLEKLLAKNGDQHAAFLEQHERIINSQEAMLKTLNGKAT